MGHDSDVCHPRVIYTLSQTEPGIPILRVQVYLNLFVNVSLVVILKLVA